MKEQDETLAQELKATISKRRKQFVEWLKPTSTDPLALQIVKTILKIPVVLLALLLSPLFLAILFFTFLAAF